MEFTRRYLPLEWEERWKRDKERRRRAVEEGGEGMERDRCELSWIMAYNDSRMGLTSHGGQEEVPEVGAGSGGSHTEEEDQEPRDGVRTYRRETHPQEVLSSLRAFRDSATLTDLKLSGRDGGTLEAHTCVIAALSSVIREQLREKGGVEPLEVGAGQWSAARPGAEVEHAGLWAALEFAYTGAVDAESSEQLQAAAVALQIHRLRQRLSEDAPDKEQQSSPSEEMRETLGSIERLRAERVGCDLVLDVGGTLIHVHRAILAASSDYFRGMFTCGMRESSQTSVALPFQSASELEALIDWSYTGRLALSWDCVFEMACAALQFQFHSALPLCLDFMRAEMTADSCLDVASFAEAFQLPELLDEANDFVLRNFWEVSSTAKFRDLQAEKLLEFLCSDGLCVPSELAAFRAVVWWVEADPEARLSQAASLMTGVRFPLMTFREFREVRAVNLRMECFGDKEVELYVSALKEFGFPDAREQPRVRRPKDALVLVGGDQLDQDLGQRVPSGELWFANSLRSGTGLVKDVEWRKLGQMPDRPRFRHGTAAMGGRLYVAGGCHFYAKDDMMKSTYSYDPEQDSWRRLADMQEIRSNFSLVVHEGLLYAVGGDKEINTNVESVEMYKPETDSWSFVAPLERALSGHAAVPLRAGIFISGGFSSEYECVSSVCVYRPASGSKWRAPMLQERAQHCMEALGGRLYAAGGVRNLRGFYTDQLTCEAYDPASDCWTAVAPLPVAHVGAASAVLEERLYLLGGFCQEDYSESGLVHRFDPSTQRWQTMGRVPAAVTDIRACLLRLPRQRRL